MFTIRLVFPLTVLAFLVAIRLGLPGSTTLVYAILSVLALSSPYLRFCSVWQCWAVTLTSAPDDESALPKYSFFAIFIFASCFSKTLGSIKLRRIRRYLFVVMLTVLLHSLLYSQSPAISILKILIWAAVAISFVLTLDTFCEREHRNLLNEYATVITLVSIFSTPFMFTSIGYQRNGIGFQGFLNHPQAFGIVAGAYFAIFAPRVLISTKKPLLSVSHLGLSAVLVLLSRARTAGIASIASSVAVFVMGMVQSSTRKSFISSLMTFRCAIPLILLVSCATYLVTNQYDRLGEYITKGSQRDESEIAEIYMASRGRLIERMTENIAEYPLSGIGFGVSLPVSNMKIQRDPFFELPISATVEKGVLPLAILEELGFVFAIPIFIVLGSLGYYAITGGVESGAWFLFVILANFGECAFFSIGGIGLLYVSIALISAVQVQQTDIFLT